MNELNELFRPLSDVEKWINNIWSQITPEEKKVINQRVDDIFAEGLPVQLNYDKSLYIHAFELLLHIEVLGTQMFYKYVVELSNPHDKEQIHSQLLDELFHCLVFLKILYLLSGSDLLPLEQNEYLEALSTPLRNEQCPKTGVLLINLICEGWLEELFESFERQNIAPKVFKSINDDERKHVIRSMNLNVLSKAELKNFQNKLQHLEEMLLINFFSQYKYINAVATVLGFDESIRFIKELDEKHKQQLGQLNLKPGKQWDYFMQIMHNLIPKIHQNALSYYEVETTPLRQSLIAQWDNPRDPTMVGQFNLNVSCLDFFNKKYPPETLTTLMLQTISFGLAQEPMFSSFLRQNRVYRNKKQFVSLAVKLPDCSDHIGGIILEDCHNMHIVDVARRLRNILQMMVYCYKKREELEMTFPHLKLINKKMYQELSGGLLGIPTFGSPFISLSNIGYCGYSQAKSPLFSNEAIKFTIMEVERRQVWNNETRCFEAQDLLPVSMSADHRIFDGNIPIPKLIITYFDKMFKKMVDDLKQPITHKEQNDSSHFLKSIETLIDTNLEIGYKILNLLQTIWPNYLTLEEIIAKAN